MKVTVLGSQGAIPKVGLFSTSLILNVCNSYVLIDCCEGVQHQLRKNKIKFSKIEIILISHAHGDHYFGLIGLISTLSLLKRDKKLTVFCPLSVFKIIQAHLKFSKMNLSYELYLKVLNNNNKIKIFNNNHFSIEAFPLKHSIYTNGFLIMEKEKNIVDFRGPRRKTKQLSKDKKFKLFSNIRMPKLLSAMNSVKNLANSDYYTYTPEEKKKIMRDYKEAYRAMNAAWEKAGKEKKASNKKSYWEE